MCLKIRILRGYIFQKFLLAWFYSYINKIFFFIKETDTFCPIVLWTIYTSHIDHLTPQHTAFEQSAVCLSVFLESFSGFDTVCNIVTSWVNFRKNSSMNMNYNYPTTIIRSIFAQMYKLLVGKYIFTFLPMNLSRSKWKIVNNTRNTYIWVKIL